LILGGEIAGILARVWRSESNEHALLQLRGVAKLPIANRYKTDTNQLARPWLHRHGFYAARAVPIAERGQKQQERQRGGVPVANRCIQHRHAAAYAGCLQKFSNAPPS
jgi:hypothetical protein